MKFRKKDYIIFYILIVAIFGMNLMSPVKIINVFSILIGSIIPTLILGTLTNFLLKNR